MTRKEKSIAKKRRRKRISRRMLFWFLFVNAAIIATAAFWIYASMRMSTCTSVGTELLGMKILLNYSTELRNAGSPEVGRLTNYNLDSSTIEQLSQNDRISVQGYATPQNCNTDTGRDATVMTVVKLF